ncbi:MAG TPA: hypothetical protein VGN84_00340 [Solirubrobacterales bacterium]|nr:hypothetical protein [Solirubrobacterales bacterium]
MIVLVIAAAVMSGCGGSGESKPENQALEERAFEAHFEYLLAEAEVLAYRSRMTANPRYARHETSLARDLLKECQEAITETECSVGEQLDQIVRKMEADTGTR